MITTKEVKKEEIKPQYGDIAKGAAITGAIAGGMVTAGEWLASRPSGKPTLEPGKEALYKPTDELAKTEAFKATFPDYEGSFKGANNVGEANVVNDLGDVGKSVSTKLKPTMGVNGELPIPCATCEGSKFSNLANKGPGVNGMATSIHDPLVTIFPTLAKPGLLQLTIVPSIPVNYCVIFPAACAGIVGNQFNEIKPENSIILNKPTYEKPF